MVQSKNSRTVVQPIGSTEEDDNARYNFDSSESENESPADDSLNNSASSRRQILPNQNAQPSYQNEAVNDDEKPRKKRALPLGATAANSDPHRAAGDTDADLQIKTAAVTYKQLKVMMRHINNTYADLQLPGNILYIYQLYSTAFSKRSLVNKILCCCKSKQPEIRYNVRWAHQKEFKKIIITNRMLMDHFPNQVEDALKFFVPDRETI